MASTAPTASAKKKQVTLHNTSLKVKPRTSLPSSPAMHQRSSASPRQAVDTREPAARTPARSRIASSPFKHASLPFSVPTFAQATEHSTTSTAPPTHQSASSGNDSILAAGGNAPVNEGAFRAPMAPMAPMDEDLSLPETEPSSLATPRDSSKSQGRQQTTTPAGQPSATKSSFLNNFIPNLFRPRTDDAMVQISTPHGNKRPLQEDGDTTNGAASAAKKPRALQDFEELAQDTIAVISSAPDANSDKSEQTQPPAQSLVDQTAAVTAKSPSTMSIKAILASHTGDENMAKMPGTSAVAALKPKSNRSPSDKPSRLAGNASSKLTEQNERRRKELFSLIGGSSTASAPATRNSAPPKDSVPAKEPATKASSKVNATAAEKKAESLKATKTADATKTDRKVSAPKPIQTSRALRASKKAESLNAIQDARNTPVKAQAQPEPEPVQQQAEPEDTPATTNEVETQDADEEEPIYEVIGIKKHRQSTEDPNRLEVLVSWRTSKPKEETTWEPEEQIQQDIPSLLWKYWKSVEGGRQSQVQDPDLWHVLQIDSHKVSKQAGRGRGRPRKADKAAGASDAGKQIQVRLLVHWIGSPERSWEPEETVMGYAEDYVNDYWETLGGRDAALGGQSNPAPQAEPAATSAPGNKNHKDDAATASAASAKTANTARKRAALPDTRRKGQAQRVNKRGASSRTPTSPEI